MQRVEALVHVTRHSAAGFGEGAKYGCVPLDGGHRAGGLRPGVDVIQWQAALLWLQQLVALQRMLQYKLHTSAS